MEFGTYPTGWHIEGDLPNQVAVSTGITKLHTSEIQALLDHNTCSPAPFLCSMVHRTRCRKLLHITQFMHQDALKSLLPQEITINLHPSPHEPSPVEL